MTETANHGRVRMKLGGIAITLGDVEHILTMEEACGLANAICYTAVDREERNMLTCTRENWKGVANAE